jgi:hypothetical protein
MTRELEVHHIEARATAIHNRLENGTHMNDKRNLVVICQACHDAIHANEITIEPLQMTSDGPERNVQYLKHVQQDYPVKQVSPKKGKWTEEEMEIMMKTLRSFSSLSLKSVRAHLSAKYGIEVSEGVLGKMRKE